MRFAWFTPLPPVRSGISRYSEELLPALAAREPAWTVDVFDRLRAHEFIWRHFTRPYDLTIYQLGNAACHDYMWPYLVRFPGLTVLHDAQLHQSRAAALLERQRRADDYRAEFAFNHPDADRGVAELVVHGLAGEVLHFWPLVRTVVATARTVAVHSEAVRDTLRETFPGSTVDALPMGVPSHRAETPAAAVRARHGIAPEAMVFAAFGRVTPEKRIGAALGALAALAPALPAVRLMLVGDRASYYDVLADARAQGVLDRVIVTGYVEDSALADYLEAADVCLCLRWPTNGETSASWLRCLAAGKPAIITDLVHLAHVPSLDPRTWAAVPDAHGEAPVAVSIDLLDEVHSLTLAMRRLAGDRPLREQLGARGRACWQSRHTMEHAVEAYRRVIGETMRRPTPDVRLPAHLTASGVELAERLAAEVGVSVEFLSEGGGGGRQRQEAGGGRR